MQITPPDLPLDNTLKDVLFSLESIMIKRAMRQAVGYQTYAAELLGLKRTTLNAKLARRGWTDKYMWRK